MFYGWWVNPERKHHNRSSSRQHPQCSRRHHFKPLSEEFHASRGAISLAFTAFNLTQALSAPLGGRLVDRVGVRAVILTGTVLLGLLLVCANLGQRSEQRVAPPQTGILVEPSV